MSKQDIFGKITAERAAHQVVRRIEVLVLEGVLRNGDRLPSERDLATEMSVSRPILREALKILESKSILETRHGQGTVIADVVGSIFSQPVEALMRSYPRTKSDYVEFRCEMEAWAAALAAERATDDDLIMLKAVFAQMKDEHERRAVEEESRLDLEFHMTIADCAHNIILIHSLRSCYQLLSDNVILNRARIYDIAGARDKLLDQHHAIMDAIVARNAGGAREAALAHMLYVASTMDDADRIGLRQENAALRLKRERLLG